IYQIDDIEVKKMQTWLWKSFGDDGFKHYYSMRKKYLVSLLSLGVEGKEQAEALGRLKELKALASNIADEYKKRKKNKR
ncbi:MAG: hypothetical protein ACTSRU_08640, partial [Candidatus Hodarchaeales archaeon]